MDNFGVVTYSSELIIARELTSPYQPDMVAPSSNRPIKIAVVLGQ